MCQGQLPALYIPKHHLGRMSTGCGPCFPGTLPTSKQSAILPSLASLSPTINTTAHGYSLSSWAEVLGDPRPFLQQDRSNVKLTSEPLRVSVRKRPGSSATQRPQLQEEGSEATEGTGLSKVT